MVSLLAIERGPVHVQPLDPELAQRAEQRLDSGKDPVPELAFGGKESKEQAGEYTFDATVPANAEYSLLVKAYKSKADVKVSLVGR